MIIAFVGVDGAGKSTVIEGVKDYLESQNKKVLIYKSANKNTEFTKLLSLIKENCIQKESIVMKELNQIVANMLAFQILCDSEKLKELESEYDFILLDRWTYCQKIYDKIWFVWNGFIDECLSNCLVPSQTFLITAEIKNIEERLEKRSEIKPTENILVLKRVKRQYERYAEEKQWNVINNDQNISDTIEHVNQILRGLVTCY